MNRFASLLSFALLSILTVSPATAAGRNGWAPLADGEAAARAVTSGSCSGLSIVKYKADSAVDASTTSSSYVNVPNTSISFLQGGSGNGCVIVTFSAESWAEYGRLIFVRARLDDAITAAPGAVQFSGDDDEDGDGRWARSRAFTFVFPAVPPGAHFVRMEYRSVTAGRRVYIGKHNTVVQHR
jgi:hypothetical protein